MVSILKKWVLVIDIPRTIYELQKKGYNHFASDFTDDTRRMELHAWKKSKIAGTLKCEGTPTEECEVSVAAPTALDFHQRVKHHGKYTELKVKAR